MPREHPVGDRRADLAAQLLRQRGLERTHDEHSCRLSLVRPGFEKGLFFLQGHEAAAAATPEAAAPGFLLGGRLAGVLAQPSHGGGRHSKKSRNLSAVQVVIDGEQHSLRCAQFVNGGGRGHQGPSLANGGRREADGS